jgi:hypothetical protein
MAVGSGDAFSLPATLLTVILLWSFLQWSAPLWLPGLAEKNPDKAKFYRHFDRSLTLIPAALILLVVLDLMKAHYLQDLTYAHVANFGSPASSGFSIESLTHFFYSTGAPWLMIPVLFSFTIIAKEFKLNNRISLFDEAIDADLRARVLRWHGLLWPIMMIGFIPSDAFAVYSEPQAFIGSQSASLTASLGLMFAGIGLGMWSYAIAEFSQLGKDAKLDRVAFAGGMVIVSLFFLSIENTSSPIIGGLANLIALGEVDKLALTCALVVLLLGWPMFLILMDTVQEKRGIAKGRRWLGLGRTLGHTMILTWVGGAVLIEPLPHIAGWMDAFWLSLTLMIPLVVFGLVGTLLPMAGLDSRPRPEAWGFFLMMSLAIPFLTIREPLTGVLVPGLYMSMTTLPLLATHPEQRPNLAIQRRGIESAVLIGLTITALIAIHKMLAGDLLAMPWAVAITLIMPFFTVILLKKPNSEVESPTPSST